MPLMTLLAFIFLSGSFLSLWVRREPKIWETLICLSLLAGLVAGHITWVGLAFIACLSMLWLLYDRKPNAWFFIILVCFSMSFKLRLIPGYYPFLITSKFAVGLENPLIGLFPLALLVPLAKDMQDWKGVLKGLACGLLGIGLLAFLAAISGAARWDFTLPSYMALRTLSNLILTSIPEEGFYRGFVQKTLCEYFKNYRCGSLIALILTSALFSFAHIFWSPNVAILGFTFLASLLYGSVYLYSGKIESAILCHFLLNVIHMTFFSYHAA
ncbi:CAAX amino terminal protease family protein [Candidatus Protochlamydia naegleriophila]|uniref:CAAX amino terminal protease family protein n=1 Tax=Candidatus Protochlamydia naegleriophila TaxID=389348 RepID=A0A0U5EUX8_9BACT|nr:type II CAAX endopeptidase family protein [Candidatus Protochlamydia naegleriophila]CUI17969.1 CAAX amino terminal protease family protein [Candidatus Protochlamydia naegleriophila]